jgi:hypothetical protein
MSTVISQINENILLFAIYITRELPKMPFFSEKTGIVWELLQEGNFATFFTFGLIFL